MPLLHASGTVGEPGLEGSAGHARWECERRCALCIAEVLTCARSAHSFCRSEPQLPASVSSLHAVGWSEDKQLEVGWVQAERWEERGWQRGED